MTRSPLSASSCFIALFSLIKMEAVDELFGYPIPFPKQDLFIALIAVVSFLPALVIIHAIVTRIASLFTKKKSA